MSSREVPEVALLVAALLEQGYLDQWATALGVTDLLAEARTDAAGGT